MNNNELKENLKKHVMWIMGEEDGNRAVLKDANLAGADLRGGVLRFADLRGADLTGANLAGANLRNAVLTGANLAGANLRNAVLRGANLRNAVLTGVVLAGADLRGGVLGGANLGGANLENTVGLPPLTCPEEGSYIGFKKADNLIVVLQITEKAKRSSATGRKCRASEAKVLRIENLVGAISDRTWIISDYDHEFVYTVGETVIVENFDDDRWNECAPGIHHFITRQEAVDY